MTSPIASYSFDESGDIVIDHSGNNDFSLVGSNAIRTASGHTNGGLTKNALGGMPVVASPPIGQTPNRTIMFWAIGDDGSWRVRWQVDSINSASWGIVHLSGQIGVQARNNTDFVRPSVAHPSDGQWHHYTGTYSESTELVSLYVDGVLSAQNSLVGPLRTDADRIDMCSWQFSTTVIDSLRIYDVALSELEIVNAMNTPVGSETEPEEIDLSLVQEGNSSGILSLRKLVECGMTIETNQIGQLSLVEVFDLTAGIEVPTTHQLDITKYVEYDYNMELNIARSLGIAASGTVTMPKVNGPFYDDIVIVRGPFVH